MNDRIDVGGVLCVLYEHVRKIDRSPTQRKDRTVGFGLNVRSRLRKSHHDAIRHTPHMSNPIPSLGSDLDQEFGASHAWHPRHRALLPMRLSLSSQRTNTSVAAANAPNCSHSPSSPTHTTFFVTSLSSFAIGTGGKWRRARGWRACCATAGRAAMRKWRRRRCPWPSPASCSAVRVRVCSLLLHACVMRDVIRPSPSPLAHQPNTNTRQK